METGTPGPPPDQGGGAPPAPEAPGPAASAPLGTGGALAQARPGAGPPSAPYDVVTEFDRQEEYNRWLPFVKWLLLIPHWFVLVFLGLGAFFALVYAWFAVLITGKFPQGVHKFVLGVYRWATRVSAYGLLMTDQYPPFSLDADEGYPARFDAVYNEDIARWRPLVNWLLAIPYLIIANVLLNLAYIVSFIAFFTILFTKRFPPGLFDFNVVAMRWVNRGNYFTYFMSEKYPPFEWG
jgi:hypothetical protein